MMLVNKIHEGCPNEAHCTKDEEKCCYLIKRRCMLKEARKYKGD